LIVIAVSAEYNISLPIHTVVLCYTTTGMYHLVSHCAGDRSGGRRALLRRAVTRVTAIMNPKGLSFIGNVNSSHPIGYHLISLRKWEKYKAKTTMSRDKHHTIQIKHQRQPNLGLVWTSLPRAFRRTRREVYWWVPTKDPERWRTVRGHD